MRVLNFLGGIIGHVGLHQSECKVLNKRVGPFVSCPYFQPVCWRSVHLQSIRIQSRRTHVAYMLEVRTLNPQTCHPGRPKGLECSLTWEIDTGGMSRFIAWSPCGQGWGQRRAERSKLKSLNLYGIHKDSWWLWVKCVKDGKMILLSLTLSVPNRFHYYFSLSFVINGFVSRRIANIGRPKE